MNLQKKAIKDFEIYYSLDICIDAEQKKVALCGLSADITDAVKKIWEVIEEHKNAEKRKKAAIDLFETVSMHYIQFPYSIYVYFHLQCN